MCGFAGIVAWEDRYRFDQAVLERMSARIAHRGPDGQGLWINHHDEVRPDKPQVGLAFRRLAIIDLDERANQPFTDHRGRWLVFNGEIYNYRELRKELERELPGYPWRTQSDTEVLLASYAAWGEKCVEHLNGMFALAIWDENQQSFYCAVDRMGQKPFYWAALSTDGTPWGGLPDKNVNPDELGKWTMAGDKRPSVIAFASELPALRTLPWLDGSIDERAFGIYLHWGCVAGTRTIYRGARKFEPSTWGRVSSSGVVSGNYFYANASDTACPPTDTTTAVATTRQRLIQAVGRQMVADVPIGCFLSGGIDSSVVAAAMKAKAGRGQDVLTFSIGFDDPRYDETGYAAGVARHLGTRHEQFTVRPQAAQDLPKLAAVWGEPFADSSALPTHYLARETRGRVKVALSGDGGDELFGGYDRYRAVRMMTALGPPPLRMIVTSRLWQRVIPGTHPKSVGTRIKRFLSSARPAEAGRRYFQLMTLFQDEQLRSLVPDWDNRDLHDDRELVPFYAHLLRERDEVQAALALDRIWYLPGDLLTKVDRCSMLHALEVRSPFMDHELVRFASTLTTDQLFKGGPKRMLREAFSDVLPAWVFKRKKMGFAVPIGEWFRGELRPMLHDHLFAADSFAASHFRKPVLEKMVADHESERVDHSQRLYALLMLELWWRNVRAT